ncbi:hypothetical protein J6590_046284 [Homalodisca vitripennis]|nr:hypothetical protein J6590_046284 [Homalodisca vitripennis]
MLGFITRSTRGMTNPLVIKTLYSSFVCQLVEYNSLVWAPYHLGLIDKLEAVEEDFKCGGSTRAALQGQITLAGLQAELLLPDLQVRRCIADVLFLTKLIMDSWIVRCFCHKWTFVCYNKLGCVICSAGAITSATMPSTTYLQE